MKKYVYDNATVYISIPTPEQEENIRKATERFVKRLMAKGMINSEYGRNNKRISRNNSNARKRAK